MADHYVNSDQTGSSLHNLRLAKAIFDVGTTGTLASGDVVYSGVRIPDGALITRCWYYVETTFTGSGSDAATIKIGTTASDACFLGAVGIDDGRNPFDHSDTAEPGIQGISYNLGADAAHDSAVEVGDLIAGSMLHITADDEIILTTGNSQTVTAGKLTIFVEYVMTGLIS